MFKEKNLLALRTLCNISIIGFKKTFSTSDSSRKTPNTARPSEVKLDVLSCKIHGRLLCPTFAHIVDGGCKIFQYQM
uniref:Uncharacterized protein n=1 Tax=Romanomermis culicivorax TaxID=13658 RepID=A0A915J4Y1_ROMCU